jgi:hypothetical protein
MKTAQLPENSGFHVEITVFRRVRRWTCGDPQKEAASKWLLGSG